MELVVSRMMDETLSTQDFHENILEIHFEKSNIHGLGFSIAGGTDDMIEVRPAASLLASLSRSYRAELSFSFEGPCLDKRCCTA